MYSHADRHKTTLLIVKECGGYSSMYLRVVVSFECILHMYMHRAHNISMYPMGQMQHIAHTYISVTVPS